MARLISLVLLGLLPSLALALNCINGGNTQIASTGQQVCICPNGYAGKECQHPATEWCSFSSMNSDAFCTKNGNCRSTTINGDHPGCNCSGGRVGDHCEFEDEMEYQSVREALGVSDATTGGYASLNNSPYGGSNASSGGLSAGAIAGVVIAIVVVAAIMAMSALFVHRMNQNHTSGNNATDPDYALEPDGTSTFSDGNRMNVNKKSSILSKMTGKGGREDKPITDIEVANDWDVPDKTLEAMDDNDGILSPTATSTQHYVNKNSDLDADGGNLAADMDDANYDDGEEEISFAGVHERDTRERVSLGLAVPPSSSFIDRNMNEEDPMSPPASAKSVIDTQGFPHMDNGYANKNSHLV